MLQVQRRAIWLEAKLATFGILLHTENVEPKLLRFHPHTRDLHFLLKYASSPGPHSLVGSQARHIRNPPSHGRCGAQVAPFPSTHQGSASLLVYASSPGPHSLVGSQVRHIRDPPTHAKMDTARSYLKLKCTRFTANACQLCVVQVSISTVFAKR